MERRTAMAIAANSCSGADLVTPRYWRITGAVRTVVDGPTRTFDAAFPRFSMCAADALHSVELLDLSRLP